MHIAIGSEGFTKQHDKGRYDAFGRRVHWYENMPGKVSATAQGNVEIVWDNELMEGSDVTHLI